MADGENLVLTFTQPNAHSTTLLTSTGERLYTVRTELFRGDRRRTFVYDARNQALAEMSENWIRPDSVHFHSLFGPQRRSMLITEWLKGSIIPFNT